jgi:hypothetical protein
VALVTLGIASTLAMLATGQLFNPVILEAIGTTILAGFLLFLALRQTFLNVEPRQARMQE